jgi:hypothetical protein
VARKLMMLATMVALPGGLVALFAIALVVVMARTTRGRRTLLALKPRLPARLKSSFKRALRLVDGENWFPLGLPPVQSA